MKKILIVITIFVFCITMASCDVFDSQFKFTDEMIRSNLIELANTEITEPVATVSDFSDYKVVNTAHLNKGIVLIRDENERISAWNIFEGKILFPFDDVLGVEVIRTNYLGCYFVVTKTDQSKTVYDVNGSVVIPSGTYENITINVSRESIYDEADNFIQNAYYENVRYSEVDDYFGMKDITKKYKVDLENKTRLEVTTSSLFKKTHTNKTSLSIYGLDDYYAVAIVPTLYVYNNKDKLVNKITVNNGDNGVVFDGKIIVQSSILVDEFSEEYDYFYNGEKYILKTKAIDLKTGKEKELTLNYLFLFGDPYKDGDGYPKYGYIKMKTIENKILSNTTTGALINIDGVILHEFDDFSPFRLTKFNNNLYYSSDTKYFYDSNLIPLYTITPQVIHTFGDEDRILVKEENKYGVMDSAGNLVIPFEYSTISTGLYKGKTMATDINNKKYIIDFKNYKQAIEDNSKFVSTGVYFSYSYNAITSTASGKFITYDSNTLANVSYISMDNSPNFSLVENTYENGLLGIFPQSLNVNQYIVISNKRK